jgi:hypothetical protein
MNNSLIIGYGTVEVLNISPATNQIKMVLFIPGITTVNNEVTEQGKKNATLACKYLLNEGFITEGNWNSQFTIITQPK